MFLYKTAKKCNDAKPDVATRDAAKPDALKRKYSIPANTLNFLKSKKLLYKLQPDEGQETFEGIRSESQEFKE